MIGKRDKLLAIEEKYDEVKTLITIGKEKGYLLYDEVNDMLPSEVSSSEELDELFDAFGNHGIDVVESEEKYKEMKEAGIANTDKGRGRAQVALDLTPGVLDKTNDPVRMYLREMGTVALLTREGEVVIAKRIERGKLGAIRSISRTVMMANEVLALRDALKQGEVNVKDYIIISEDDLADQKIDERRHQAVLQINKVDRAYRDCKTYAKRFAKLKKRSRGYVKGKWKLGRLRIKVSKFIQRIDFTENFLLRMRDRIRDAVETIAASERRVARFESKLNGVKGRGKAKDEERSRIRSEIRKTRATSRAIQDEYEAIPRNSRER